MTHTQKQGYGDTPSRGLKGAAGGIFIGTGDEPNKTTDYADGAGPGTGSTRAPLKWVGPGASGKTDGKFGSGSANPGFATAALVSKTGRVGVASVDRDPGKFLYFGKVAETQAGVDVTGSGANGKFIFKAFPMTTNNNDGKSGGVTQHSGDHVAYLTEDVWKLGEDPAVVAPATFTVASGAGAAGTFTITNTGSDIEYEYWSLDATNTYDRALVGTGVVKNGDTAVVTPSVATASKHYAVYARKRNYVSGGAVSILKTRKRGAWAGMPASGKYMGFEAAGKRQQEMDRVGQRFATRRTVTAHA